MKSSLKIEPYSGLLSVLRCKNYRKAGTVIVQILDEVTFLYFILYEPLFPRYFNNAKSVLFHPQGGDSLEALTRVLSTGFAGCVHFSGVVNCEIKVLILLYSPEKKTYLGFIPNDQVLMEKISKEEESKWVRYISYYFCLDSIC